MLAPTAAWKQAMRRHDAKPRVLVEVHLPSSDVRRFVSGDKKHLGYPNLVGGITTLARSVDPKTRKPDIGDVTITFHDHDALRALISGNRLKGKKVVVYSGEASLTSSSDWLYCFTGVIEAIEPPRGASSMIDVLVRGPLLLAREGAMTGYWVRTSPLTIIEGVLDDCMPAEFIDSASFDPDAYTTTISHWRTARSTHVPDDRTIIKPESRLGIVNEVALICGGSILQDEDGDVRFLRYDSTTAASRAWTEDDVEILDQGPEPGEIINMVRILFGWRGETPSFPAGSTEADPELHWNSNFRYRIDAQDNDSRTNFAYPGESARNLTLELESKWIGCAAPLKAAISDSALAFRTEGGHTGSFCGMGSADSAGNAYSDYTLSSTRIGYFKIGEEIVKVTALTPDEAFKQQIPDYKHDQVDDPNGPVGTFVAAADFTIAANGRAQFGTTAVAHAANEEVVDVTIAVALANSIIERFSNGLSILRVGTTLAHQDLQVGDFVTVATDRFLGYGLNGLTSSTKWEILAKEVTPIGEDAGVEWTLGIVRSLPTVSFATKAIIHDGIWSRFPDLVGDGSLWQPHVQDGGLVIAAGAGLVMTMTPGVASSRIGSASRIWSTESITLPASKDVYPGIDGHTGHLCFQSVANGAAEPDFSRWETRIGKVVTGGAAISSVADRRLLGGLSPAGYNPDTEWAGTHLLPNGDFGSWSKGYETMPDRWVLSTGSYGSGGDVYIESTLVLDGKFGLAFLDNSATAAKIATRDFIPVEAGAVYTLAAQIRQDAVGASQHLAIAVEWFDSTKTTISTSSSNEKGSAVDTWTSYRTQKTAPSTARWAKVSVTKGTGTAFNAYLSRLSLARSVLIDDIADATLADLGWVYLGSVEMTSSAASSSTLAFGDYELLRIIVKTRGMDVSDIPCLRFNGDTGSNYWNRFLTAVAGGTTLVNTQNTSGDRLRLTASGSTLHQIIDVLVNNFEFSNKVAVISGQRGTSNVTTAGIAQVSGGGEYVASSDWISSVQLLSNGGNNILDESGFAVWGKNLG